MGIITAKKIKTFEKNSKNSGKIQKDKKFEFPIPSVRIRIIFGFCPDFEDFCIIAPEILNLV